MWLVAAFAQAHFNNGKLFMVLLFMVTVSVSVFFFCELTFCLYLGCKLRECFIHLKDHRETEPLRNIPAIITFCEGALKTSWKLFVNIFSVTIIRLRRRLKDVLEEEKLLRFIMTKTDNHFVMSLDFVYVLHFHNAENSLYICMKLIDASI